MVRAIIGGGLIAQLFNKIDQSNQDLELLRPAIDYENVLRNTNFSGHIKQSTLNVQNALGYGILTGALALPSAYITNAYNQRALYRTGKPLFPGAGSNPKKTAIVTGATVSGLPLLGGQLAHNIGKKLQKLK